MDLKYVGYERVTKFNSFMGMYNADFKVNTTINLLIAENSEFLDRINYQLFKKHCATWS
jgi:hypothetical protein